MFHFLVAFFWRVGKVGRERGGESERAQRLATSIFLALRIDFLFLESHKFRF